ncbi:MAG: hypothetical protein ACRDI0_09775 [Actinomycetota bacterium]
MTGYDDPGWGPALRRTPLLVLIPFLHLRAAKLGAKRGLDGLTVLRMLFLYFVSALLLFLVVLAFIAEPFGGDVPPWMLLAFGAVLLLSVGGALWARARPLDASGQEALAASYRTTFFVGLAFGESAALYGFVAVFLVGGLLPYLAGLAVSVIGFAIIAPTRSNIERRQAEIAAGGSSLSLAAALMRQPTASGPSGR